MNFQYKYGVEICNSTCGVPYTFKPQKETRTTKKLIARTSPATSTTTTLPRTINETCEEYNVDYFGNDIECLKKSVTSWEACAKMCSDNDKCTHWTWISPESGVSSDWVNTCCTKTSDAGRWTKNGMVSGSKECGACEEIDTDLVGNDIDVVLEVSTWEECSHICQQRSDCSFWTWVGDEYTTNPDIIHECHLKNSDSGREKATGLVSGSSDCGECKFLKNNTLITITITIAISDLPTPTTTPTPILKNETCESENIKLISGDDAIIAQDVPTWKQCANLCAAVPECSHWNWIDSGVPEHKCSMLTSVVDKKEAPGVISGTTDCGKGKFLLDNTGFKYWL